MSETQDKLPIPPPIPRYHIQQSGAKIMIIQLQIESFHIPSSVSVNDTKLLYTRH